MHEHNAWDVAFSPDGTISPQAAVTGNRSARADVILSDVSSGITRAVLPHPASVSGLAFAPADAISKGSQILVTGCNDHLVRVWDTSSARLSVPARPRELHGHEKAITQVVFRPHGKGMFATGGWDEPCDCGTWSPRNRSLPSARDSSGAPSPAWPSAPTGRPWRPCAPITSISGTCGDCAEPADGFRRYRRCCL